MCLCTLCFACACTRLDTGGPRSHIEFKRGGWLFSLPQGSLTKNFPKAIFETRYQQSGSPLADRGRDGRSADFAHWLLRLHPDVVAEAREHRSQKDIEGLGSTPLFCCPEDHACERGCAERRLLCRSGRIPICRECWVAMQTNAIPPKILMDDNNQGYLDARVCENGITWI